MCNAGDEGYGLRPWHCFMYPSLEFVSKANAGIMCLGKKYFDLDLVEWFLGHNWPLKFLFLYEQTFWAFLAARIGGALYNPAQRLRFPLKES